MTDDPVNIIRYTAVPSDEVGFRIEPSGEWVRYEDVKNELAFINGYLLEHRHMLESLRAHSKIIAAVQHLRDRIESI